MDFAILMELPVISISAPSTSESRLRWLLRATALKMRLAALSATLKAGFDPNQPRVPAGDPDGGQWTRVGSDSERREGVQVAQGDRLQGYRIDLREEERLGDHRVAEHVAKSYEYLALRSKREARRIIERGDDFRGISLGSFTSLDAATRLVNSALAQNQETVDRVASGEQHRSSITARFSSPTGFEAYLRTVHSEPVLRNTYGVTVVIAHDPGISKGFRVITAFPANW